MIADLIRKNRSYRRFYQEPPISMETLRELVDLARLSPCSRNAQPLKFILSCAPEKNAVIFAHLAWAGYLTEWPGPGEGERPTGYIIILNDKEVSPAVTIDQGIAAQSIMLGAVERGLGGCMMTNVQKGPLSRALNVPERYEILLVLALGKPHEEVVIEPIPAGGSIKYWRDERTTHHVPKRSLDELVLDL